MSLRRRRPAPEPRSGAAVSIEVMRRRHLRAVIAIEERIFTRPWTIGLYVSELSIPETRLYYVALVDGTVVGYAGCMLVSGEGHITTVGVAPNWQRLGVATRLLHRLAGDARAAGVRGLTLEVRLSNAGAQDLYRRFGFVPAGVRKNYYTDDNEDALIMWAHDVDLPRYEKRLAEIGDDFADGVS